MQNLTDTHTIANELNKDVILQQLRLKIVQKEYSILIFQQAIGCQHYCSNLDQLSIHDETLTRECYDKTVSANFNQLLLSKLLDTELLE